MGEFNSKAVYLRSNEILDCEWLCGVDYPWLGEQEARDEAVEEWRELVE